jgi:hypothetical protein
MAVGGRIGNGYRLALDRNSPLPLNIHIIQYLIPEVAVIHKMGLLNETVSQCGLAVIDVRDNAKITGILNHYAHYSEKREESQAMREEFYHEPHERTRTTDKVVSLTAEPSMPM